MTKPNIYRGARQWFKEDRIYAGTIKIPASNPADSESLQLAASTVSAPTLAFSPSAGTDEQVFFDWHAPFDLDGNYDAEIHLVWASDSGWSSGSYRWAIDCLVFDEEVADLTAGSAVTIFKDATPNAANQILETEFAATIDIAPDQVMYMRLYLDASESGADGDGHLLFVEIKYVCSSLGPDA